MTFYQILTLASIVEREAVLAEEKPTIAGVYQNRIDGIKGVKNRLLNADPTVIYGADTVALAEMPLRRVAELLLLEGARDADEGASRCPANLAGLPDVHRSRVSSPWPIATPSLGFDRCGARPGHQGQATSTSSRSPTAAASTPSPRPRHEHRRTREVRLQLMAVAPAERCPSRPTSPHRRRRERLAAWDEADRDRPAGAPRPAPSAVRGGGRRCVFRRSSRAHALPHRVRARRGRGAGRGQLRAVPRDGRRDGRPRRLALHGSRRNARRRSARIVEAYRDLPTRWPELLAAVGAKRVAVEADVVSHADWERLAAAAPDVELVPGRGLARGATGRPRSRPSWSASRRPVPWRIAHSPRSCRDIQPGVTEAELALDLEWLMRTSGAEALAFDVACLAGPEAALPHGSPGDRPVLDRAGPAVRLRRAGCRLPERHDADALRRRADRPRPGDLRARRDARRRQRSRHSSPVSRRRPPRARRCRSGRAIDARRPATSSRPPATATHFGHGARTRDRARDARGAEPRPACARRRRCRSPTVFSVEPGIYLDGETGVRIEDLVALDAAAGTVERLTRFPREVLVVGG